MEQTNDSEKQTIEAPSPGCVNVHIVAQGNVFAPILNKVQGAKDLTFNQSGANLSESDTRDITSVITAYKESVKSMYAHTREYTSLPGEHVRLADRYVDPLIIQRHREKKEKEEEICSKGKSFFNLRPYDTNIGIVNLFRQEDGPTNECPKAVILQGNSGNGKSFIAQKIILDWAKGDVFSGSFDLVFHLQCSELNDISGDRSLVELLNHSDEMTQILKDKEKRVLFLIDGFDELRCPLPEKALPVRVDSQANPGAVLSSLLRGNMLKESFLLVTTRSTSSEKLGKLLKRPQRFTEIMGFSEKGVQEYFQKFFAEKDLSTQVHEQVKTHEALYTACFSPVMCWLTCNVFKQKHNMGTSMTSGLNNTTSIFIDFVFTLLEHHCQSLKKSEKIFLLKNLGQLAEEGILKGKILFEKDFVPEEILNMTGLPFLCTFHHRERTRVKEMFSFMHLSFQEFFAALFYVFIDKTEAETKIKQLLSSDSDLGSVSPNYHLLPVIQFLCGLSNKEVTNLIHEELQHGVSQEIVSLLKKWMNTFVKTSMTHFDSFILHCLYEVNDENIVRNVMKIWETKPAGVKIFLRQMTDYRAAAYCLQSCRRIRSLVLRGCTMQTLKMMKTALTKCDELDITMNYVSDDDVDDLISAMGKGKDLQDLRIKDGSLSDHSVQRIMSTLPKQRSVGCVYLPVKAINKDNTEILMNKCQKTSKLSLKAATVTTKEESLCSYFAILNFNNSKMITFTSEEVGNDFAMSNHSKFRIIIKHNDVDSSVKCGLALVNLSVGCDSAISDNDMKNLLRISFNLKEIENPQFEEHADALLSFLRSIHDFKSLMLDAKKFSLKSAAKILAFSQDRPSVERGCIRLTVYCLKCINEENVCSLSLSTNYLGLQDAQKMESKPMLQHLKLKFPCMEGATVNWEDLFKTNSQLLKSNQRTCFFLDEEMKKLLSLLQSVPSLTELYIHLESLPENWAAEMINFLQACSSLKVFKLTVGSGGETLRMIRGGALSDRHHWSSATIGSGGETVIISSQDHTKLYFGGDGDHSLTPKGESDDVHRVLPFIILCITIRTDFYNDSWAAFFNHYNQLKAMTELCPAYDQCMDELLFHMNTIPDLKEMEMALRFLTVHGALSILHLFQTSSSLRKIGLKLSRENMRDFAEEQNASDDQKSSGSDGTYVLDFENTVYSKRQCSQDAEIENYELALCSELSVRKNRRNECRLSLRCNGTDPDTKAVFAYISLITVLKTSQETEINWRCFFQSYYETKGLSEKDLYFAEKTNALLSFLHDVPGLEEVEFGIHSLTESWAPRILSLCHAVPNMRRIRLELVSGKEIDMDSICSSLTIKRNFTASTVTVKIDMLIHTIPSLIHLNLPCSELSNLDGAGLLSRLRCLKGLNESSQGYDKQINELIAFLQTVPHLQKLKLHIENLSTAWATRILSFKTCQSLTKIIVTTSSCDILMEEAISELEKHWTSQDCVVVVPGWRCSNPTAKCLKRSWLQACNKNVKLSFCGGRYSEEPLKYGLCEIDSEREENQYYRFADGSLV